MSKGIYNKVQEHLKGYSPQGCCVENRNSVFIPFQYDSDKEEGICIAYYTQKRENIWSAACWGGYYRSQCNIVSVPQKQFILVGWHGDVITQQGFKESGAPRFIEEESIPILRNCPIMRIRNIGGKAYIAASWRTIFRRDNMNDWICLHGNNPKQIETWKKGYRDLGFDDIGGFSEDDIYACGGQGDLWHFDGERWKELDFPKNIDLTSLCCAPDGNVYIGCGNGMLAVGRDNSWEILSTKAPSVDIMDMAWYKDRLYLACNIYGLYVYDKGKIKPAEGISSFGSSVSQNSSLSSETKDLLAKNGADTNMIELAETLSPVEEILAPAYIHSLSTDGDILLVAGTDKVVAHNGSEWKVLYAPPGVNMGGELW